MKKINETEFDSLITSFSKYDQIAVRNKILLKRTFIFDLYEGTIENNAVYLVTFKGSNFSSNIMKSIIDEITSIVLNPKSKELEKVFLTKSGYYYDENSNEISFIYLKRDSSPVNIEQMLFCNSQKYNRFKDHLIKLEIIRQLIEKINNLKESELIKSLFLPSYGMIHPDLIFYSQTKGFFYFDFVLNIFLKYFGKYHRESEGTDFGTNMITYFGIFNQTQIDDLAGVYSDYGIIYKNRGSSKIILEKLEIVQFLLILIFFFSNDYQNLSQKKISYEKILYNYQKDFVMKNSSLENIMKIISTNFNSNDDLLFEDLTNLLLNNLYSSDDNLLPLMIEELFQIISDLLNNKCLKYLECEICAKNIIAEDSILNLTTLKIKLRLHPICFDLLCDSCFSNHSCNYIQNLENTSYLRLADKKNSEVAQLKIKTDLIPSFKKDNLHKEKLFYTAKSLPEGLKLKIKNSEDNINSILLIAEREINLHIKEKEEEIKKIFYIYERLIKKNVYDPNEISDDTLKEINNSSEIVKEKLKEFDELVSLVLNIKKKINQTYKITNAMNNFNSISLKYYNELKSCNRKDIYEAYGLITNEVYNFMVENNFWGEDEIFTKEYDGYYNIPESSKINPGNLAGSIKSNNLRNKNYSKFVAGVNSKSNLIHLMNAEFKKPKLIRAAREDALLANCRWVNMRSKLFISGGVNSKLGVISKACYYMDYESPFIRIEEAYLNNKKVKAEVRNFFKLPNMITERDQHSIIIHKYFNIICVGGSDTATCEQFNFLTKKWTRLPELNEVKCNCNLFLLNDKDLYLFFGLKKDEKSISSLFCDQIEKLSLYSDDATWQIIKYTKDKSLLNLNIPENNFGLFFSSIINYSNRNIFILGGRMAHTKALSKYSFKYNFEKSLLSFDKEPFKEGLCFNENMFVQVGENEFNLWSFDMSLVKLFYD